MPKKQPKKEELKVKRITRKSGSSKGPTAVKSASLSTKKFRERDAAKAGADGINQETSSVVSDLDIVDHFPNISSLVSFGLVLKEVKKGHSFQAAIAIVSELRGSTIRTTAFKVRKILEEKFGLMLFETRPGQGKAAFAVTSELGKQRLEMLISLCERVSATTKQIAGLSKLHSRPEVRIGMLTSMAHYLLPAVIHHAKSNVSRFEFGELPHITVIQGEAKEQMDTLLSYESDFFLYMDGISIAKSARVSCVPLKYRPLPYGVVFVKQDELGKVPFPNLSKLVDDEYTTALDIQRALYECPLLMMQQQPEYFAKEVIREIHKEYFSLKTTDNSLHMGPRICLPTYRSERHLMHCGLGVGFSHEPDQDCKLLRTIEGARVLIGKDKDFPENEICFIDLRILEPERPDRWQDDQQFALYFREGYARAENEGGLSSAAYTLKEMIHEVVNGSAGSLGYLKHEGISPKATLLHHYHFSQRFRSYAFANHSRG